MQTVCNIDDWACRFAQIQKTTTIRNGPAIEMRIGLGLARITDHESWPGWVRIELVYPPNVTRDNRDGVPFIDSLPSCESPLQAWNRLSGRIYGYRRALEKARDRGVLTCP